VNGSVSMESGALIPGTSIGTLTFANNLSLSGTVTNAFEVGYGATNDKVMISGDLSLSGSVPVRIIPTDGAIANGTYVLFKWSGNLSGGAANLSLEVPSLPGTFTLGENLGAKEIYLQVSGVTIHDLAWRGDVNSTWDVATTANWRTTNGSAVTFSNFNNVISITRVRTQPRSTLCRRSILSRC